MNWVRQNGFLVGIISALLLAFLVPDLGKPGGILQPTISTKIAIVVIFLLQGFVLPTEELVRGLRSWKLHAFVQGMLFIVAPILTWVLLELFGQSLPADVRLGFLFLAMLPTTISTAVIYTTRAGGSISAALFNVVVANIAGVVIVPLWMAYWANMDASSQVEPMGAMLRVGGLILLPLMVGHALRLRWRGWIAERKSLVKTVNSSLIVFIIYCSFAGSFASGAWEGRGTGMVLHIAGIVAAMAAIMIGLAWLVPKLFTADKTERWCAFFCASQKGLAAGVPLAKAIFVGVSGVEIGLLLLPLLLYHPLLLLIGGVVLSRCKSHP